MATSKQLFRATPAELSEEPTALQLVRQLPNGSGYGLCREAVDKLKNMGDCPIAVVSIAGVARSGKSHILNRLLQMTAPAGFRVSSHVNPCTHGIWVWPIAVQVAGKAHRLVLMDTEGSASKEQSSQSSAVIMALAAVASSLLIYNHPRFIDENMVDDLSLTARILKDLFKTSGDAVGGPICQPPHLLMLVRDNDLVSESSLAECPLTGANVRQITERNATRLVIRDVFKHRTCCLLPRPALETNNLEDLAISTLNPEFVKGVDRLRSTIWSTTSPKAFKGKTLTGPLLVELLTAAITTANKSGGVLNVGSMWSAMVDAELSAAATAAQESYKEKTKELDGCMNIKQAQRIHQVAMAAAIKVLHSKAQFADKASASSQEAKLEKQLGAAFSSQVEIVKVRQAELAVRYNKMLTKARATSLEVFDKAGILEGLVKSGSSAIVSENELILVIEEHAQLAYIQLRAVLKSWTGQFPEEPVTQPAAIEQELQAFMQATQKEALAQIAKLRKAAEAEARAKAAAADLARLREQQRLVELKRQMLDTAVRRYEREIAKEVQRSRRATELVAGHKAVLSSIVRDTISEATSRLTNDYLTVLKSDLIRQCEGMLDTNIVIMEKQVAAKDKATVAEAARKAVRCYKDEVTSAVDLQHTTDHTSASNTCKVAAERAHRKFRESASAQSTYLPGSEPYVAAKRVLEYDIASWQDHVLLAVRKNQDAKEAKERAEREAAEQLRLQKERAAEQRRREEAEYQARLARLRAEEEEEDRERERERCRQQAAYSTSSSHLPYGSSVVYLVSPSSSVFSLGDISPSYGYGAYSGGSSRHIGITTRGNPCKICLKGHRCPYH